MRALRIPALTLLALATGGCSGDKPAASEAAKPVAGKQREWTDAARIEAIASTLQACSYEGTPVKVDAVKLQGPAPGDCKSMVDKIMGYTGLPANFVVTAGPVPNAAAVILLDDARVPQRVIAFNPDFIRQTQQATGGDTWAPVSIMAHEIGHHLSGHTITSGGSRPDIELEADKFSGYVLQKMGASLSAATKAILTFGTDTDQPTHPSKDKRAAAIGQGWQEACSQAGATRCTAGTATTTPVTTPTPAQQVAIVKLPAPSPTSIPFKYGRFVVDEIGLLDPAIVAEFEKKFYDAAANAGVEVAVLLVKDLRGMSADDYAFAMMRQLRVGKLDLGNGAVFVYAPEQDEVGVAMGPGIEREMENANFKRSMKRWVSTSWPICKQYGGCRKHSDGVMFPAKSTIGFTRHLEWTIRYQSMKEFLDTYKAKFEQSMKAPANRPYDPKANVAYDKIVRFRGKVVKLDTPVGITMIKPEILSNASIVKRGYRAVHLQSEDGIPVVFYVHPKTPAVLPAGELKVGGEYTFVGRIQRPDPLEGHAQHMWALSYDPL